MNLNSTLRSVAESKHEEIHVAALQDSVFDAARTMAARKIGAIVVLGDDNRIAGILSERDVMTRVVAAERDPKSTTVSEVMTVDPQCVAASMTVAEAMRKVTDQRIRHLPLVTADKLEGLVSSGDLMAWVMRAQETEIDTLSTNLSTAAKRNAAIIALIIVFVVLILIGVLTT